MAARTMLNTILRDAAKTPLLRMTVKPLHGDDGAVAAQAPRMTAARWSRARQKLPDGQLTFARGILSSPFAKNIPLCFLPKSVAYSVPSYPTRGALRTSRNARWDAMDARAATDERG